MTDPTAGIERAPDDVVVLEVSDRIATVTLNRPGARNALSTAVRRWLPKLVGAADARDDVDAIILTGADPAFCAGLDLKELGTPEGALAASGEPVPSVEERTRASLQGPMPPTAKPLIGAINGVAITGGLEIALNCDFLIASELARFADTHARIGVQPGWGLTVLLPQAVGIRRAREMSATGNFVDANTALAWGLVNHVVPHGELIGFCRQLAADISSNDPKGVQQIYATYDAVVNTTGAEGWEIEQATAQAWQGQGIDPAEIERRRQGVIDRGRTQL